MNRIDLFAKTGSGQTYGKLISKDGFRWQAPQEIPGISRARPAARRVGLLRRLPLLCQQSRLVRISVRKKRFFCVAICPDDKR
jgi:hypothetical protein